MEQDKHSFFTKQFDSWQDFEREFENWRITYYEPVNIKRSSMKYNEKLMEELFNRFRYQHVMYVCHHSGPIRRRIKDGSRPNQESARLDCQFYFKIKHDTEVNKIIFMNNKNLTHNHPLDEKIYKNYSFVRNKKLQENTEAYDLCKTLISANASTYNNRKILNGKFNINLTRKDINNFKKKLKFNLVGSQTDPELLQALIDEILNENSQNSVQIKVDENGILQCLYIQTYQMKVWFKKYPNIVHIDSTFKVNIENYQLYICLVQNANLKGVPVAYCLMISGIKDYLEFFYSEIGKYNDLTQTQVIMVDKDLNNIDVLQHYFDKARILLCVFHVLKYLKNQIHVLKISLTNRMNIMENIRKLLYDNDQMSAIYLEEIKINSEETDFYEYLEKNWLSCCEMWQTKYRKTLFNFDTDTNNHLERFNRTLKDHITSNMHISECLTKLLVIVDDIKAEEMNLNISLKQKIYYSDDSMLLKKFGSQMNNKAIELLRKQNDVIKLKNYFIEEIEDNSWKIGQKDEEKNHFISSSIISHDSDKHLLFCDCQFYFQNQLPCRHLIVLFNKINDDIYDETHELQKIMSINKRWLKNPVDYYLNKIDDYDNIQSYNSKSIVTQVRTQKNKVLNNNDKHNIVKPTLDILTARIIQCGTNEFNEHLKFLNVIVDLISLNKQKELYDYANSLKHDYFKHQNQNIEQETLIELDHIEEEMNEQNVMKFNQEQQLEQEHDINLLQEHHEHEQELELESNEEQTHIILEQKTVINYSPVINPRGRPRGKASLVNYKEKGHKNNQDKINKKRTYKQTSPDLKNYNVKRNKKLDSIRDIHDKTTWLTDFHIYLFFELLHKQFPNVNGLCSPARIHLYNGSLENSIFIFNANANHWLTISNLNCNNVWNVYDSLSYQKELLINFFQVILPNEEKVSVSFENVQQQVGGNDCGLFALAFATSLCYKDVPSLIFYDQISLRNHYVKCIEDNEIQRFPSKPKRGSTRNASKLIDLYLN